MTTIQIEVRDVYGTPRAYPVCETARAFTKIAGTKTMQYRVLTTIEDMGYEIEIVSHRDRGIHNFLNQNGKAIE